MLFPELGISGYAIDDLLCRTRCSTASRRRSRAIVEASAGAAARCCSSARRCAATAGSTTAPSRSRAAAILGVVPKSFPAQLPRVLREPLVRLRHATCADVRSTLGGRDGAVRHRPPLRGRATSPDFVFHVEICEDFWAPTPPSTRRARRRADPCNLSASNIVVGKADDAPAAVRLAVDALPGGLRLLGGRPRREHHRPRLGRPGHDPRARRAACARPSASRCARRWRSPTSTSSACASSACARRTFNDAAAAPGIPESAFRRDRRSTTSRPRATSASSARSTASRSCPTIRRGSTRTATRRSTSRSRACASGCRPRNGERIGIGVSGGLDSTHALIVAAKAFDALGLPRTNILGFTMPGFAHRRDAPSPTPGR